MTGPEHYREAERLTGRIQESAINAATNGDAMSKSALGALAALAQVHATLALAAATLARTEADAGGIDAWIAAAGVRQAKS